MSSVLFKGVSVIFPDDMMCVIDGHTITIRAASTTQIAYINDIPRAAAQPLLNTPKSKSAAYNSEYYQKRKQAPKHRKDLKNLGQTPLPFDARPWIIEHLTTNYGRSSKFHISRHVFKRSGVTKPHPWWWGKSVNKMVRDMIEEGTLTIVSRSEVGRQYDIIGLSSMIAKD